MFELKTRRICLDFHTSPDIEGIGKCFDREEFGDTLDKAGVTSIQLFSRCHHGMMYYPTKLFPERIHPYLEHPNLLGEQIEACKKRGIQVTIYTTVQWDHYTANKHPEWLTLDETGLPLNNKIYEPGFRRNLCVNTPYKSILKKMVSELLEMFEYSDSMIFDIVQTVGCSCRYCREGMVALGMDPTSKEARLIYAENMMNEFKLEMTKFVHSIRPNHGIFYNRGYVGVAERKVQEAYTHYDIESLPSGEWGYMNFPVTSRYVRNMGKQANAQTGKFHTWWGDFSSFKNLVALEYECFFMIAMNYGVLIGDQLEPNGRLSKVGYELIGSVYEQLIKKEPWCLGARALIDICVFTTEEFYGFDIGNLHPAMTGITRMLQELGHQFDIVDSQSDISSYKLAILPDKIEVSEALAKKLDCFILAGGKVIASYTSGLYHEHHTDWKSLGVRCKGKAPYSPDFIVPEGKMGIDIEPVEHVMYKQGMLIEQDENAEVLCWVNVPYFNREWNHFCSHQHTPSSGMRGYPGIIQNGNVIYFMHPIFEQYDENAPLWCKKLVANAIDILMPKRLVSHSGPSTLLVTLNEQKQENRMVLHALHYIPERRSKTIDIIEDVIPLHNIAFKISTNEDIKSVVLVPEICELEYFLSNECLEFVIPKINGHQMVEIRY